MLGPVITEFVHDQEAYYRRWAQRWFENVQFIFGNSSVRWSKRYDFAVDVDFMRRDSSMSQRASTNIARIVAEALGSLIYANLPTWRTDSTDESSLRGRRFGKIIEKLLTCYMERLGCDESFAAAAMAYVAFGQQGYRVDWVKSAGTTVEIPQWRKTKAPVFTDYLASNPVTGGLLTVPTMAPGSNGAPYFEDRWEPITDSTGRQVINKVQTGDARLSVLTPFEYRRAIGSHSMNDSRFVEHIRLIDYDEYLEEYGDLEGGTRYAHDVQPLIHDSIGYAFAVRHFMRLQFMTPPTVTEGMGARRTDSVLKTSVFKNKVLVLEHFDKPNREMWPTGRRVVVVNGKCTHVTKPQYTLAKKGGWHPFVEAKWLSIPPSSISSGPMDSVTAKNRELNVTDSLIATSQRRNLGSVLLYKHGSGFDPNKLSGEPGQMQGVADPAGVRWLHDEMPISPVLQALRSAAKDDVYEQSGAMDALRGDRTKGVSSGYALRQLEEREQKRLTPARKNFEAAVSQVGQKLTACIRQNVVKLDDQTMGFMRRSGSGEFTTDDVVSFLHGPVDFGVDVSITPSSMVQKSQATQQANLLELAKGPAQTRIMNDAEVLDNFLTYFDAEKLRDGSAAHRDRANRENDVWGDMMRLGPDTEGIKPPLVLLEDDDKIHMAKHTEFIVKNSEELLANEFLFQSVLVHNEQHRLQDQEKSGMALPGTALQIPGMMAQARNTPPPGMQNIYMATQAKMQADMANNKAAQKDPNQKPPQAAQSPAPPGSNGPPQTTTQAPSKNTPSEATQGGASANPA